MAQDGIDFLLQQHEQVRTLIGAVQNAPADTRQSSFDELRQLLAVHETAEELVLRPVTRKQVPDGETVADARMSEENESKDVLSKLEKLDASSDEFTKMFASFAADVEKHAQNEEQYEFPLVRQHQDAEELEKMGERLQKAESMAPTHPHPSARSTTANLVLGPFAAMVDKVRDALHSG